MERFRHRRRRRRGGLLRPGAGLIKGEGARRLIDLAGTRKAPKAGQPSRRDEAINHTTPLRTRKRPGRVKAGQSSRCPHKRRSRQSQGFGSCHPRALLLPPSVACSFAPTTRNGRAWVITDSRPRPRRPEGSTAHYGSTLVTIRHGRSWQHRRTSYRPLRTQVFPNIALVEGGPDFLAAFHLAWCATSTQETLALGKGVDVIGNLGVPSDAWAGRPS